MTGVFTDNQPDFSWLKPYEEKEFNQFFMPYKEVGAVKNANTDFILNLQRNNNNVEITVYSSSKEEVIVELSNENILLDEKIKVSPNDIYSKKIK